MSKYEQDRVNARRIVIEQLLEIDRIGDDEIDGEKQKDNSISHTLIRLSKMSRVERAFNEPDFENTDATNADKFLYNKDGLPE